MGLSPGQMPDNQDPKPPPPPPTPNYHQDLGAALAPLNQLASGVGKPNTVPKIPNFKVPGALPPPAKAVDPYQQYKASVAKNLQYLTAAERKTVQQRQSLLDQQHQQLQANIAANNTKLQRLAALSKTGNPQANKLLQTFLNAKGYNLQVDGSYGNNTYKALADYFDRTQKHTNTQVQAFVNASQLAHPMTVRAQSNSAIAPLQNTRQRAAVVGYTINQISQAGAQLQAAQTALQNGKQGADQQVANIKARILSLQDLQSKAKDPIKGYDATSLDQIFHQIMGSEIVSLQEENNSIPLGLGSALEDQLRSEPGVGQVFNVMDDVFNRGSQAFAAAFETGEHTGNYFKALQAYVGSWSSLLRVPGTDISLVGVVAPGGSDARKWIEATNSQAERDALVAKGDLLSIGQTLTGSETKAFAEAHPNDGIGNILDPSGAKSVFGLKLSPTRIVTGTDFESGLADFLTLPAKDPTILGSMALEPVGKFGTWAGEQALKRAPQEMIDRFGETVVRQFGIIEKLTNTVTGRALTDGIGQAIADVTRTGTTAGMRSAIKGLDIETAAAAIAAREAAPTFADGVAAATKVVTDAIVEGKLDPHISALKQLTNSLGDKLGLLSQDAADNAFGLEASLGRKAIQMSDRLAYVRQFAESRFGVAGANMSKAADFVTHAFDTVSRAAKTTWNGLWHDTAGGLVDHLTMEERFYRVVGVLEHTDNPALKDAFYGILNPFTSNPEILDHVSYGAYMDYAFAQQGFEDAMRKVEVLAAYADGSLKDKMGEAAFAQLDTELRRGFGLSASQVKNATTTAAQNIGLSLVKPVGNVDRKKLEEMIAKLPADLRDHFEQRLNGLGGRKGIGKLARDVASVSGDKKLADELTQVLERQKGRLEDLATPVKNSGLGIVKQKVARAILSTTDVIPPRELLFKYPTANEAAHVRMRSQAMTRYLDAFFVPKAVSDSLVRAAENAQSEDQLFAVAERAQRAGLQAQGVGNIDAVMQVLRDRGEFTREVATRPIRTVIDGQPIEDLQVLTQRIESVRIASPHEAAAAARQAIIDGSTSASIAEKMGARLHIVSDKLGEVSLHVTNSRGQELTLAKGLHAIHRLWKVMIVTNAGMPFVGAAAGFFRTNGSLGDRLHNAGLGFLIGSVAPARYLFRVVGVEDRFRMFMDGNFLPDVHLPAWAHLRGSHYAEDPFRRFISDDITRVGNYGTAHVENDVLVHTDPDWVALPRDHARAPDAWFRIVNHQLDANDPVTAILLRERAGHLGGEEAVQRVVSDAVPFEQIGVIGEPAATPPEGAAGLWSEAFGPAADTAHEASPLEKALNELVDANKSTDAHIPAPTNDALLEQHPDAAGVKTFFRGEPAANAADARGAYWTQDEALARNRAGADGITYHVDLPVGADGIPLVGEDAGKARGEVGWLLAGKDQQWADAADHALPNGFADSTVGQAGFRTETTMVQVTSRQAADAAIKEFLGTEEGALWLSRWKGAIGGTSSAKEAVARMRDFIERYTTPEIAALRVSGGINGTASEVAHDTLTRLIKSGEGPDFFHAQQVWKFPRSISDVFAVGRNFTQRTVLAGPTNFFNRGPYGRQLFRNEYDRLVGVGVEREEAQRIADNFAAEHENQLLHRFDEPTRLAAKVDIFMPFQHAREDIFRVYTRLLIDHPVRATRVVYDVARLFNNAKAAGIFTHNDFTNSWEVAIPGSARLAHDLFGTPFDVNMHANLAGLLFINSASWGGNFGGGFLPQPGGPFWSLFSKALAETHPEVFSGSFPLHDWLWGYGPNGNLLNTNTSRLWMAFSGETPPWEFGNQANWKNQLDRWRTEVGQQLMYQHRQKNPGDANWTPTNAEVDEATSSFFKAWAFFGAATPTSSYPTLTGQDKYWMARNAFTLGGIKPWDPQAFLKSYPEYEPFVIGNTASYTGPDDLATINKLNVGAGPGALSTYNPETDQWDTNPGQKTENYLLEEKLGYRTYENWDQFKDQFKQYQRTSEYYTQLKAAEGLKNPLEREAALVSINKKYADIVASGNKKYDIERDIYNVTWKYPKQLQADALTRIKNTYGLTNVDMNYYKSKANNPLFLPSAWREARLGSEVATDVSMHLGKRMADPNAVAAYVATLNPAEQYRYWQWQMDSMGYDHGIDNPSSIVNKYDNYRSMLFAVRDQNSWLFRAKDSWLNPFTEQMKAVEADLSKQTDATYTAIDRLNAEMDNAAATKAWGTYNALKAKRDDLYNVADAIHNKLLDKLPDLTKYYEDMHAAAVYGAAGNETEQQAMLRQAEIDKAGAGLFQIPEEKRFLSMPAPVQRAYMDNLIRALDMPAGKIPYQVNTFIKDNTGLHKLFWSYLTPTQQHILEANFSPYVAQWKYDDNYYLHGAGAVASGHTPDDLKYAYAILDKYSQRGDMKEPALYQQYLNLPTSHKVRIAFLAAHPDVKAYLEASPYKHMPAHIRDIVTKILAKYGKFTPTSSHGGGSGRGGRGGRGFGTGNLSVEWAKYQLSLYGKLRKNSVKPPTYDLWVNMPSGPEKAQYLEQHPEISQWVKLGPMANMPPAYQEVVRSIMTQYGLWTARQDPLGKTITAFFNTPGYARNDFLQKHPELSAYWAVTRSPQEQAMFDLQNTYFQIQDVGARQAFLASHPELQQHMVQARTDRYETFLNQVALYMGANPAMFQQYLQRQQDITAELLRKFAEPNIVREAPVDVSTDEQGVEAGRLRGSRTRRERALSASS